MAAFLRIALGSLAAVGLAGGLAWVMLSPTPPRRELDAALVMDRSGTISGDGCTDAQDIGRALVNAAKADALSVQLYGITDRAHADQPALAGEPVVLANHTVSLDDGPDARLREQKRAVADILARCRLVQPTQQSPILAAVRTALAQLKGQPPRPGRVPMLIIRTDGLEEHDPQLVRALHGSRGRPSKDARAKDKLDNTGVRTVLCGTAQRAPHRGWEPSPEVVKAAWEREFKSPVTVLPYCHGLDQTLASR